MRFMRNGTLRDMGLGSYPEVTLAQAREAMTAARQEIKAGKDPITVRRQRQGRELATERTFQKAAERYIASNKAAWSNQKHAAQWDASLQAYAYPHIGQVAVQDITTAHVLRILEPIWTTRTETASRVRGRIEAVLDYAGAIDWREGENPARWKGKLASLLPAPRKVQKVVNHPSLPWPQIAAFVQALRERNGTGARAIEFAILTCARSGEVRGLTRRELDLGARIWTVPADRMKARRVHRVPLSAAAMSFLAEHHIDSLASDDLVFPGAQSKKTTSDMTLTAVLRRMNAGAQPAWTDGTTGEPITVHGFRSTFRVWAGEQTSEAREVIEHALAHAVGSEVEAAYARTDLLERRRSLMEKWGDVCRPVLPGV